MPVLPDGPSIRRRQRRRRGSIGRRKREATHVGSCFDGSPLKGGGCSTSWSLVNFVVVPDETAPAVGSPEVFTSRRFQHDVRMHPGDPEQHLGRSAGSAGALFPVVQGAEADAQQAGELGLGKSELLPRGGDRRLPVRMLLFLEGPRIHRSAAASALAIDHNFPDPRRGSFTALDALFCGDHLMEASWFHGFTFRLSFFKSSAPRSSFWFFA